MRFIEDHIILHEAQLHQWKRQRWPHTKIESIQNHEHVQVLP